MRWSAWTSTRRMTLTANTWGSWRRKLPLLPGVSWSRATWRRCGRLTILRKIVHAAVFTVNREDLEMARSRDIVEINVAGTANVLEMARLIGPERFVYISSGSMYGMARAADQYFNEDDPSRADTLYGMTKAASEAITQRYGELHGFQTASLRLSTPYGPMERVTGHRDNMSIPHQWTGRLLRGEPIGVDRADVGRDFTYVLDIASAIATVVEAPALPHDRYNITNGAWVTGEQIQRTLARTLPGHHPGGGGRGAGLKRQHFAGPGAAVRLPAMARLWLDGEV